MRFNDATIAEVDAAMKASFIAFDHYKKTRLKERASFLAAIAAALESNAEKLITLAAGETHLGSARLKTELKRTIFQLTSYGKATEEGRWLDVRIDLPPSENNEAVEIRKTKIPLGPVVVFGASNFPFAYSTAGGDTASALAAGCTVVVKGHPAHAQTSEFVAGLIRTAAKTSGHPEDVFIHLHGASNEVGEALVDHDLTAAVGFTGSVEAGTALFARAAKRTSPIPVFAEMGSVNPVFILPQKLKNDIDNIATMYAKSITLSAGQFCTNPGVLTGIDDGDLSAFKNTLAKKIAMVPPEKMLHPGIAKNFQHKRADALEIEGVEIAGVFSCPVGSDESIPTLAEVSAQDFLNNPLLQEEVFGPFSILVKCRDEAEMLEVARSFKGQLTCSILGEIEEVEKNSALVDMIRSKCGRLIMNGVPTGVQVASAMQHGGPFPATTDSRFTAVGADAIRRFARPVCYQNWPDELLPDELKNTNPLGIWRLVNDQWTNQAI